MALSPASLSPGGGPEAPPLSVVPVRLPVKSLGAHP